jgi:hypothetical protein
VQWVAGSSSLSLVSVVFVYIWIGVRPFPLHVSVRSDERFHSGTYDGTGKTSRGMTGSCFSARLTSIWSVELLSIYLPRLTSIGFIFFLICVPVVPSRIRNHLCLSRHHQCPVGSLRDCHNRIVLHGTGSYVSSWCTWSCHDHTGSSPSLYVLVTKRVRCTS